MPLRHTHMYVFVGRLSPSPPVTLREIQQVDRIDGVMNGGMGDITKTRTMHEFPGRFTKKRMPENVFLKEFGIDIGVSMGRSAP